MTTVQRQLIEMTDDRNEWLLPWLDLFETAFPPEERILVSEFLQMLRQKAAGESLPDTLLAAVENSDFLGLAHYQTAEEPRGVWLWYLAVVPERRCQGAGAWLYGEIVQRARAAGAIGMVIEVEIPEEASDEAGRALAARRIDFYRRQGALLLQGIHYMQHAAAHQPAIPMHVMVHPFIEMTPAEGLAFARAFLGRVELIAEQVTWS